MENEPQKAKERYCIYLPPVLRPKLERLAKKHKFRWGNRGNVQAFFGAIANNKFDLTPKTEEQTEHPPEIYNSGTEVEHLLQSFWTLRDTGQDDAARTIANILLERYEVSEAVTQHLEAMVNKPQSFAVEQIKTAIANKQPFTLNYQSASGRDHEFSIEYAEINKIERHFYLCCWVKEASEKIDIPELAHNCTLRLDRITEATLFPVDGKKWRNGLDAIELEFKLIGRWAKGYEAKPDDIETKLTSENDIPVRYVKRRVIFWHWIGRELLGYGAECTVLAPSVARELIADEVKKMNQNYQEEGDKDVNSILLISSSLNECGNAMGDSLKDALESFHSSRWEQGYNANARLLDEYGEWAVYQFDKDSPHNLTYCGDFNSLLSSLCPDRL